MRTLFTFMCAVLLSIFSSYGQDDCSICEKTLKHGTTDEFIRETKHSIDESVSTMFTKDFEDWEKYDKTTSKSRSLDAAYQVYKASFSSISDLNERKETYNRQRSSYLYSRDLSQKFYEKISSSLINKTPYNSFNECIRDKCGQGLYTSYDVAGDDIVLTVRWYLRDGDPNQKSKLITISYSTNVRPVDAYLMQGAIISPNNSITSTFKRNSSKEKAIIRFSFENLRDQNIVIEGESQLSLIPIGTIIASTLSFRDFCLVNDPNTNLDYNNLDYKKILWVPADGRGVRDSRYSRAGFNVPDLRGIFLRGLNQFDPNSQIAPDIQRTDPETNRGAGSYQKDALLNHSHSISKGFKGDANFVPGGNQDGWFLALKGHLSSPQMNKIIGNPDNVDQSNLSSETRPKNVAVYYYIRIN